ncbi:glycosyltransferase [Corynebacterium heidelbergense]|uniref:Sugar transferase n=1 Tax=Corynebacterium heidelbergense TaxID=2055947 RepID=A0A364V7Z2_9CORY|nr:glycosyltransferase [Corynebacterium heidelbergense]RAV32724.1 sugar transferase [Corynebacterium heidelbergense]
MKIAFIGPARFPIREPYAGGLEAFCHILVKTLRTHGHDVDFYAARGSDGHVTSLEFPTVDWADHHHQATDDSYPPGSRELEDLAFRRTIDHIAETDYDLVHNNSLHPSVFGVAAHHNLLTTLHTPPVPDMQEAILAAGNRAGSFAAVSAATAGAWRLPSQPSVIHNGVDCAQWKFGPGGPHAIWFGRIVPEKGPHVAIDAARAAGLPLIIVGRVGNPVYFRSEIAPRLGPDVMWLGVLPHSKLARLVGRCCVTFVTPRWDEPFGMVAIESLACGTPVAAIGRGGVTSVLAGLPIDVADDPNAHPSSTAVAGVGLADAAEAALPGGRGSGLARALLGGGLAPTHRRRAHDAQAGDLLAEGKTTEQHLADQLAQIALTVRTYERQAFRDYAVQNFALPLLTERYVELYRRTTS